MFDIYLLIYLTYYVTSSLDHKMSCFEFPISSLLYIAELITDVQEENAKLSHL